MLQTYLTLQYHRIILLCTQPTFFQKMENQEENEITGEEKIEEKSNKIQPAAEEKEKNCCRFSRV